jgi:hypothetical protein
MLRDDMGRLSEICRLLLHAARAEGIGPQRLPDFLSLEQGGELTLLGQYELGLSVLEESLREQVERDAGQSAWSPLEAERILLAAARVGQHVFARQVLTNCGSRCVFWGLQPAGFGAKRMLLAGHIKPWKDSTSTERLDMRNGLAACPAHDVAFDTGLLATVGCASTLPSCCPMPPRLTRWPGSTTGDLRCCRPCCSPPAPRRLPTSTSTGTARTSSLPDCENPFRSLVIAAVL